MILVAGSSQDEDTDSWEVLRRLVTKWGLGAGPMGWAGDGSLRLSF